MAFFQTQQRPHEPAIRAPAVVLWLIGAFVAVYLLQFLLSEEDWRMLFVHLAFIPARYASSDPGTLFEQAAPFFTYMFLHAGIGHLVVNSLWLLAFGPIVARRFGSIPFLVFFFVCGILAVLLHLSLNWDVLNPVIGASGAISGLMAAAIRMIRLPGSFSFKGDTPLAPILSRPVLTFTFVWSVVNVVVGLTGLGVGNGPQLIAWEAHMGGFIGGLLLAGVFDRLARTRGSELA